MPVHRGVVPCPKNHPAGPLADRPSVRPSSPVPSIKTRIQLDPVTYNRGMIAGFRQVVRNEGAGALLTGFGPTFIGYFIQGAFKFGGYEFFKKQAIDLVGVEKARRNRAAIYSLSAASAEFFASVALCPLEATRIRLVSTPGFAKGLFDGFGKILRTEGVGAFYSGFGPILFKQYVDLLVRVKNELIGVCLNINFQSSLHGHKVCCF